MSLSVILAVVAGGLLIGVFISVLTLRMAARWVSGYWPPLGMSIGAVVLGSIASVMVSVAFRMALSGPYAMQPLAHACASFVLTTAIYGLVVGALIARPGERSIGFLRGCAISLIQTVMIIAMGALIAVSYFAVLSLYPKGLPKLVLLTVDRLTGT